MKKQIPASLRTNLRFLLLEISSQLAHLDYFFLQPSHEHATAVTQRNRYVLNLTQRIHYDSHKYIARHKEQDTETLLFAAVTTIASILERISELCAECTQYAVMIHHKPSLQTERYNPLLTQISDAIALIEPALSASDTRLALRISAVEKSIKFVCNQLVIDYTFALKQHEYIDDLIAALFVAHSIEHIADALLTISEALISGNLGQTVNIDRYHTLQDFMQQLNPDDAQAWSVKPLAHTRSGGQISTLRSTQSASETIVAIFKDGTKRKVQEEQQCVEIWHQIYPGIAPRILSYNSRGDSAALLIEYLDGMTFENLLLNASQAVQQAALAQLCSTLQSIWHTTHHPKKISARFMNQLKSRLPAVYRLHPEFKQAHQQIGGLRLPAFDALMKQAQAIEIQVKSAFSVYIHGDFNSDNIIYDPLTGKINFIDLHRSSYNDYVQDVSVFMVSNYRLQVLDSRFRHTVLRLTLDFYDFVRTFAQQQGDDSFELRLALGLARSFASSTRFILDKTLASAMFMRARYLIEQVLFIMNHQQQTTYRVPIEEIFSG